MTANDLTRSLQQLEPFKGCSDAALQNIEKSGSLLRFDTGHALSHQALIPDCVQVILSGRARLLWEQNGLPVTIGLLGPGSLVGLPSLLRAESCEEVSAMEPLEALSIPDALIAELYRNETSFKRWCQSTLFPAELAALLESLLKQSERIPYSVSDVLSKIMPIARTITGSPQALSQLDEEQQAFISSSNTNLPLNAELGLKGYPLPTRMSKPLLR